MNSAVKHKHRAVPTIETKKEILPLPSADPVIDGQVRMVERPLPGHGQGYTHPFLNTDGNE